MSPPAPVRPLALLQRRWFLSVLWLAAAVRPVVAEEKDEPPPPRWRLVPLPVYATVPNEGSTYGLMPVLLGLTPEGAIRSIFAPSASWNSAVHVTGTFRYYRYPSPVRAWQVIASGSTRVNRSFTFEYNDRPRDPGRVTTEVFVQARRSLFYRFFGLGPDSAEGDESSYVRTHTLATVRVHYNLPHRFAVGLITQARRDWLDRSAAFPDLPSTQDRFPDAPGLEGGAFVAGGLNLRLDTRERAEYSDAGVGSELSARYVEGLRGFDRFVGLLFDTRVLLPTTSRSQTAGRLLATYALGGARLPFYYQSSLGGELRLRGFTEDRFIDSGLLGDRSRAAHPPAQHQPVRRQGRMARRSLRRGGPGLRRPRRPLRSRAGGGRRGISRPRPTERARAGGSRLGRRGHQGLRPAGLPLLMVRATVRGSVAAGLVGLALAVFALLPLQRNTPLGAVLAASVWPLLVVSLARVVTLALYTVGWRALLPRGADLRFWPLLRFRWIGEAINALLPALQVGGDLARARLVVIRLGVPPGLAGAALILDLATGAASQVLLVLLGVAVLLVEGSTRTLPLRPAFLGLVIILATVAGLLAAVRFTRRPLRALASRLAARATPTGEGGGPELDAALRSQARRGPLARSFTWHLLGWFSQAAETWLILRLVGAPVGAGAALVIDSLAGAARAAAFFLPGGLGVQEGALGHLALAHGVPPEAAVTLVIVKRLREVVVGLPALVVWAFHERALLDRLVRGSEAPSPGEGAP